MRYNKVSNECIDFVIDDQLFFETLLMEIRGKTISYSCHQKRQEQKDEEKLLNEIKDMELKDDLDQESALLLDEKRNRLKELREKKLNGMIVRSRIQWINQGERPSKSFCNLENRNFVSKRMCFLEKENGDVVFDNKEIVKETKKLYQTLYSHQDVPDVNLNTCVHNVTKLTDDERDELEGVISYNEAHAALRAMKNNKSPGSDGFTCEFFKFFFCNLGVFMIRSLNFGFQSGRLSVTQRQGIIICIPKEGKPKQYIKNWRPISLLNTVYKIASACIANRIKGVLPKLINSDQRGFMKGRYIGENIRLLYDVLVYTNSEKLPGLLLLLDFEKAFDNISWKFIDKVLDFLNFGPEFKKWIHSFYYDIMSCISVNSLYSQWFHVCRGVRQGDPLSPYLYLLGAEILADMLRENERVKGITVRDREIKLSQFTDDTALCLDGTKQSFEEAVRILTMFSEMSGSKIN